MPRILKALLLLVVLASPARASPALAVQAARADAQRQPVAVQRDCRYLSLYAVSLKQRSDFLAALAFHCNSLSQEAEIIRPVLVTPDLLRISLLDYGIDPKTWEKLAANDPYFHAILVKEVVDVKIVEVDVPIGYWRMKATREIVTDDAWIARNKDFVYWQTVRTDRREVKKETKRQETITSAAPWLPAADIAALYVLTGSECPIVRGDWWLVWTAIQAGRKGAGYYDFLGLKTRLDAEKLAGLDVVAARRLRKELAALVAESGVALNNRQIIRYQTISGGWWVTLDSNTNTGKQNALSLLDGDFKHDAEEIYFVLPNGLFGLVASDAQGALQATVPDTIAPDHVSTSNDRRIHPGLSCVRCHVSGLQPIDDWARSVYQGPEKPGSPIILAAVSPVKLKRLRQLYLSPLKSRLAKDNQEYADALLLVNGLTPQRNAAVYAAAWHQYAETSLGPDEIAAELGVTREVWLRALKQYAAPNGQPVIGDPVLVGMLGGRKVRREHAEERHALMQQILAQGR